MNDDSNIYKADVHEKIDCPKIKKQEINLEKSKLEKKSPTVNVNTGNSSQCDQIEKNYINLETDFFKDGVTSNKDLSDGEASSGFETVSSADSRFHGTDIDDLDLGSFEKDDCNVVVVIQNELAFHNMQGMIFQYHDLVEWQFFFQTKMEEPAVGEEKTKLQAHIATDPNRSKSNWRDKSRTPSRYSSRYDHFLTNDTNRRHDNFRAVSEQKHWQNNNEYKNYRRDKKSSEREDFSCSYRLSCRGRNRGRDSTPYKRSRRSGRSDDSRFRRSSERSSRSRSRASRSLERNIQIKSPGYEDRIEESGRCRSFDKSTAKPYSERNSPSRKKRRNSFSKSTTSSVWQRLESRISPSRLHSEKKAVRSPSRNKERTPFLVKLDRKLEEADKLEGSKQETNGPQEQADVGTNSNSQAPVPELMPERSQNSAPPYAPTHISPALDFPTVDFPLQYTPLPTMSVDNLPLVPGPTGLPVHITLTGEQIPHDFDGRRIPMGPNGYYLPLDPTGRLFAHIVSPGNQAVPIHMTEDGVLRLPNSDPVPYGPPHQLPVNIDGTVIPIGPDSKPLYACPDLPRQPPLILKFMNSLEIHQCGNTQPEAVPDIMPQTSYMGNHQITELQQTQISNTDNFQSAQTDSTMMDVIQNPSHKVNRGNFLKRYNKKARKRCGDVLKCIEIEKGVGVSPSRIGVKRSTLKKFSPRNSSEIGSSGSDMVLDSCDSDSSTDVKSRLKPDKGSTEEISSGSGVERDILKAVCDKEGTETSNSEKGEKQKNVIIKKIQKGIKLLSERDYKPPVFGRFIVSNLADPIVRRYPNDSPLLRNRVILPFLTPNVGSSSEKDKPVNEDKIAVISNFSAQGNAEKGESSSVKCGKTQEGDSNGVTFHPVLTLDFAVQCDFTSVVIQNLNSKVTELEMEVVRLRNVNANLLGDYRNVQAMNEKKGDELRKAILEIQERNSEIQDLRRSAGKKGK